MGTKKTERVSQVCQNGRHISVKFQHHGIMGRFLSIIFSIPALYYKWCAILGEAEHKDGKYKDWWNIRNIFQSVGKRRKNCAHEVLVMVYDLLHSIWYFKTIQRCKIAACTESWTSYHRDIWNETQQRQKERGNNRDKLQHQCLSCTFHRHMISSRTRPRQPQWPATWNRGMIDYQRKGNCSRELCGFSGLVLTHGFEHGRKAL